MRRRLGFLVAVEALLAVLLAVTINVATGGSLPDALSLLRPWAWPLVAVLGVLAVAVPLGKFVLERPRTRGGRYSSFHRDNQRSRILDALARRWVQDTLDPARVITPRIDLTWAVRADAVDPPEDLLVPPVPLDPAGSGIRDIFERLDRSVLVLGGPGAGKSTLVLELAAQLLSEARDGGPIPVVLQLARWRPARGDRDDLAHELAAWCVREMAGLGIPRQIAATWLDEDALVFLFDGLDEMPASRREDFLRALHGMQGERGPLPVLITCRSADYEQVSTRPRLQGAVAIEPLPRAVLESYLERNGARLAGLRAALNADERLWEVIETPLFLDLLTRVADDGALEGPATRTQVLGRYIDVTLSRRGYGRNSAADSRRWLTCVAEVIRVPTDVGARMA